MKIIILNGNPYPGDRAFDEKISGVGTILESMNHSVNTFTLRDMKVSPCIGCFNCWVKTPGLCVFHDDAESVLRSYIHADFALLASPLVMGYVSALSKTMLDRLIPLIHPYLEEVDGEVHHLKRYATYPRLGLLLKEEADTDEGDRSIVHDIFTRAAINIRSNLDFVLYDETTPREAAHAIDVH